MMEIVSLISHALLQCGFDAPPFKRWGLCWQSWAPMAADGLPWSPHALRNLRSAHTEALCEGALALHRERGMPAKSGLLQPHFVPVQVTVWMQLHQKFHTRTAQRALPEFWFAETREDNKVIVLSPSFFLRGAGEGCFAAIVIGTQAHWLRMRHWMEW